MNDLLKLLETAEAAQREVALDAACSPLTINARARIAATLDKALDPYRCRACRRVHIKQFGFEVCGKCRAGRPAGEKEKP